MVQIYIIDITTLWIVPRFYYIKHGVGRAIFDMGFKERNTILGTQSWVALELIILRRFEKAEKLQFLSFDVESNLKVIVEHLAFCEDDLNLF